MQIHIAQPQLGVPLQLQFIFVWTIDPILGSHYNMNSNTFGLGDPIIGSCYNMNSYIFGFNYPILGSCYYMNLYKKESYQDQTNS